MVYPILIPSSLSLVRIKFDLKVHQYRIEKAFLVIKSRITLATDPTEKQEELVYYSQILLQIKSTYVYLVINCDLLIGYCANIYQPHAFPFLSLFICPWVFHSQTLYSFSHFHPNSYSLKQTIDQNHPVEKFTIS